MPTNFNDIMNRMRAMREAEGEGEAPPPADEGAAAPPPQDPPPADAPPVDPIEAEILAGEGEPPLEPPAEREEPSVKVSTLEDVSEVLGVPVEDLYNISVPMSQDGKRVDVRLGEWKDNYQSAQKIQEQSQQINDRVADLDHKMAQWGELVSGAETHIAAVFEAIEADEKSVDWKTLREDDPTEYVAKRQEFQDRKANLGKRVDELNAQRAKVAESLKAEYEENQRKYRALEREELFRQIPDWKDETVAQKDRTQISAYLKEVGFSDHEITGVTDHRAIMVARDAARYRAAVARAKAAKKGKGKTPTIKPSGRVERKTVQQEKVDQARQRLRKTGKLRDATAAYRASRDRG